MAKVNLEEEQFINALKQSIPAQSITVDFKNGVCGLENMTFPSWTVKVVDKNGVEHTGEFADRLRYYRSFGDTAFHCTVNHIEDAVNFFKEIV